MNIIAAFAGDQLPATATGMAVSRRKRSTIWWGFFALNISLLVLKTVPCAVRLSVINIILEAGLLDLNRLIDKAYEARPLAENGEQTQAD